MEMSKKDINHNMIMNYRNSSNEEILLLVNNVFHKYNREYNVFFFSAREKFTTVFGWSVPDKNILNKICSFVGEDAILEIG
jgi:hypothetical protein